ICSRSLRVSGPGFRAQARILPLSFFFKASRATWHRIQIDSIGGLDGNPLHFFAGNFGCSGPADHGWFCDRRFDVEVQRAHTLETAKPRAARLLWTRLDREVDDRALAVP